MKKMNKVLSDQHDIALDAFFDSFFKLPNVLRREVIGGMPEGMLKRKAAQAVIKLEEAENSERVIYLALALKMLPKEKQGVTK